MPNEKLKDQPSIGTLIEAKKNPAIKAQITDYTIVSTKGNSKLFAGITIKTKKLQMHKNISIEELRENWKRSTTHFKRKNYRNLLKNELHNAKQQLIQMKSDKKRYSNKVKILAKPAKIRA